MRQLSHATIGALIAIFACSIISQAQEPLTLMGRIADWRYPGSQINGATMSDAATINSKGVAPSLPFNPERF